MSRGIHRFAAMVAPLTGARMVAPLTGARIVAPLTGALIAPLLTGALIAAPKKAAPAPAKPAAAEGSPLASRKLAEGVWAMMTKGGANAGWFTFGDTVIAVDAGRTASDAQAILAEIGRTTGGKKVSYLILTNDFGPHAGGAAVFARSGASIVTHESFVGSMQGFVAASPAARTAGPVVGISSRLVLARPERHVVVRHLGSADSGGDLAVLLSEDKIVFTGDLAEAYVLPPLFSKAIDPEGWDAALGLLEGLHPTAVIPGYGPIGPPSAITATREYLAKTLATARKIVEERVPDDAIPARIGQPDVVIAGLPDELKKSHEANVRALVTWLKSKKAAPTK